jgi:hypothetical protein
VCVRWKNLLLGRGFVLVSENGGSYVCENIDFGIIFWEFLKVEMFLSVWEVVRTKFGARRCLSVREPEGTMLRKCC